MQKRLKELKKEIALHNYRYYALDDPLISDAQYDALFSELLEIEAQHPEWVTEDSPSQRVGSAPVSGFDTRSEERRVGKACRDRWWGCDQEEEGRSGEAREGQ